jgi:ankyrin repeat protein
MKTKIRFGILTLILAVICDGCFLIPPPRSEHRPIHQYAESGDLAAVATDLATNSTDLNLPDDGGLTPLHLAASHCHTNVMAFLLNRGAAVNRKAQGGTTPLHLAAQEGCLDGVNLLLEKGAKINVRDSKGRTPLKRAEEWQQIDIVQFLRERGGQE